MAKIKNKKFENAVFLIPARKNSKGLPFKNRKLFTQTSKTIPEDLKRKVYVSTDDKIIENMSNKAGFNVVRRPEDIASDESSLKDVLLHFRESADLPKNCDIILLFLTYPERTWQDICKMYSTFLESTEKKSMICCEEVDDHPYLCFLYEEKEKKGQLLIEHDRYRRQDYPHVVRQSMFFACYKSFVLDDLHDLLFEKTTLFYKLKNKKVDVDYEKDYNTILERQS